jgi:leader peptidase (prepilin peptidase)/N-methyltransferase
VISPSFADYEEWAEEEMAKRQTELPEQEQPENDDEKQESPEDTDVAEMWIQYPHARREMVLELAFLMPPVLLAMIGGWAMSTVFGGSNPPANAPMWLVALSGVLMGYLIGGGVVWAVRIGGSLAFGKEAMGLGDVHMMAAVGACLGWVDPTIAFFLAAFVGVAYAAVARIFSGKLSRAMPYGPFLAVATLMVVFGKPLVELGLGAIFHSPGGVNIP